ncbi:MAG: sodium:proton antiporter [Chitinophagaceae bacterium]
MNLFLIISILVSLSALFAYLNERFLKLPDTIGIMVISLIFSLVLILTGNLFPELYHATEDFVSSIDFGTVLVDIMLCFLLFAGALHTDISLLKYNHRAISVFAVIGVLLSALITGVLMFYMFRWFGQDINIWYCIVFGALVAPTDPIAVLGILTKAGAPKHAEIKIVGESLFNDGIGVVLFLSLIKIISIGTENITGSQIILLLLQEVVGGIALGIVLGWVGFYMMKKIDNYQAEILITLAMVMGGYSLAEVLHVSGPLAMVMAGLFTGSRAKAEAMSHTTELYLDKFWELADVLLNAILFVLIGLELLVVEFSKPFLIAGLIAIPISIAARYISLIIPSTFLKKWVGTDHKTIQLMTWGGLRGGLSIAMALSLQDPLPRNLFVAMTYIIVLFSIIVQGLTLGKLVKKLFGTAA